jgi:hypothetical protein
MTTSVKYAGKAQIGDEMAIGYYRLPATGYRRPASPTVMTTDTGAAVRSSPIALWRPSLCHVQLPLHPVWILERQILLLEGRVHLHARVLDARCGQLLRHTAQLHLVGAR